MVLVVNLVVEMVVGVDSDMIMGLAIGGLLWSFVELVGRCGAGYDSDYGAGHWADCETGYGALCNWLQPVRPQLWRWLE